MNAGGKDHGGYLEISQFLCKLVVGQKAAQRLCHISCMYIVMVGVLVVSPLNILQQTLTVISGAVSECALDGLANC